MSASLVPRQLVRSNAMFDMASSQPPSAPLRGADGGTQSPPSSSPRSGDEDGCCNMELENTPPMIRYSMQCVNYDDYVPFSTRAQAVAHLENCKMYLAENIRFLDKSEIEDTLLCIVDAEDELRRFDSRLPSAARRTE